MIKLLAVVTAIFLCEISVCAESIDLSGTWRFKLDSQDVGVEQKWDAEILPDTINLPGTLQAQGYGNDISVETEWTGGIHDKSWYEDDKYAPYRREGNIKIPFWLQPPKHYVGAAWYQREVRIPVDWAEKHIVLFLERCHWETRVWVDDREIGKRNSLVAPHEYDLTGMLAPGTHTITIRVNNRMIMDIGINAHSVSDNTQGNWNGIIGKIELRATGRVWIEDAHVYGSAAEKSAKVKVRISNITGKAGRGEITAIAALKLDPRNSKLEKRVPVSWDGDGEEIEFEIELGEDAKLWDEFTPNLYRLFLQLRTNNGQADMRSVSFGLRDFESKGRDFYINGRKVFLRGTLECCIFPLTGYPPTDAQSWIRMMRAAKEYGLNHLRFHSYCPPQAAFEAADIVGVYLQAESPFWNTRWASKGVDDENRHLYDFMVSETGRILETYGNHPSFCTMTAGNEMRLHADVFGEMVRNWRKKDPRHLYSRVTGGSKYASGPESDFQSQQARMQRLRHPATYAPSSDFDLAESTEGFDVPILAHEVGQWCVFPNLDEIDKYTGFFRNTSFEMIRDFLAKANLTDMAEPFLMASGRFQTLLYKAELEAALRTKGQGGLQLLDLHDFPGQGTALVGVLDPFWDSKGYVTGKEYRKWCSETVILARMKKFVWTAGEILIAGMEVANFGPGPMHDARLEWSFETGEEQVIDSGTLPARDIPVDRGIALGSIEIPLRKIPVPAQCVLKTRIRNTEIVNDWDIWVYPEDIDVKAANGVSVTDSLSEAVKALAKGGNVFLYLGERGGKRKMHFEPIFWNSSWFKKMRGRALCVLCDPEHPALAQFPTDYHSNWQWWYLCDSAAIMELDELGLKQKPLIQVVPDWNDIHRLALAFEARVGRGGIIVTSLDFSNMKDANPVRKQLLRSFLSYMEGPDFNPSDAVAVNQLESIIPAGSK
jgi:hypothetical protein